MSNLFGFQEMHRHRKRKLESINNERGYKLQGLSFTLYKLTPSQSMNDMWIKFRVSQIIVKASEL